MLSKRTFAMLAPAANDGGVIPIGWRRVDNEHFEANRDEGADTGVGTV